MAGAECGPIIPIEVEINVLDVDAKIALGFDEIKVERSTTNEAGPFVEVTNAENRLPLVASQFDYFYTDEDGSAEYWYRFRLFNSTSQTDDAPSGAAPGEPDAALDILSIEELKTFYLFGIDLTDDRGVEMPDKLFAHYIKVAVDQLETRIQIKIKRQVYTQERHDFIRDDYDKYIWTHLHHYPVISIEDVRLVLPGEQVVQVFEKEWFHPERHSGQLQLVPGTGTAGSILLGASGAWIPFIYGNNKFIPDAFRVSYTAGFGRPPNSSIDFPIGSNPPSASNIDPDFDTVPQLIKDAVGKMASFGPFNIAGDLLGGAGIASQSIGIDGLSQSFATTSSATNAGFGARLIQYQKELKEDIAQLRRTYSNYIRLQVV